MQFICVILECIFVFFGIILVLIWGVMVKMNLEIFMKVLEQLEVDSFDNTLIADIYLSMIEK